MAEDDSFEQVMERLRDGDPDAASVVFGRFVRRLVTLSSRQFDPWLRHKADPEDLVQSAYKSFFLRYERGDFDLADWESLWALLALITVRKCHRKRDYLRADCRDAGREAQASTDAETLPRWNLVDDREPTPLEVAMLTETVEELLKGLGRPEREIVELSLQGFTTPEIVKRLGRSQRTVQRVRERVKLRIQRMQQDDDPATESTPGERR